MEEDNGKISSLEEARAKREDQVDEEYSSEEQLVDTLIGVLDAITDIYSGESEGIRVEDGNILPIKPKGAYLILWGEDGDYVNFSTKTTIHQMLDMVKILTTSIEKELVGDT